MKFTDSKKNATLKLEHVEIDSYSSQNQKITLIKNGKKITYPVFDCAIKNLKFEMPAIAVFLQKSKYDEPRLLKLYNADISDSNFKQLDININIYLGGVE